MSRTRTVLLALLPVVAYGAGVTLLATRGYHLARTALHMPDESAWTLPALVDVYVLTALLRRRDVGWAIGLMAAVFAAGVAVDALTPNPDGSPAGLHPMHAVEALLGAAVVLAMWRVAELVHGPRTPPPPVLSPLPPERSLEWSGAKRDLIRTLVAQGLTRRADISTACAAYGVSVSPREVTAILAESRVRGA
jgi:hypothetical protein